MCWYGEISDINKIKCQSEKLRKKFMLKRNIDIVIVSFMALELVAPLCPTLGIPMDCSPPGSSVYGILQARTLSWAAIPFSRGSSQPRDQTQVSCIVGRFFTTWDTREALCGLKISFKKGLMYRIHVVFLVLIR